MSHLECCLNQSFWRSKKVVQVAQIGGRGRGNFGNAHNSILNFSTVDFLSSILPYNI